MYKPLKNRVIIEPIKAEQETSSGLIKPESATEKPQEGVVKAIGKDVKIVKIGDKVLTGKFTGFDVTLGGTDFTILTEDDILVIIT